MKLLYSIGCEWDIGQEDIVIENYEEVLAFAKELWNFQDMDEEVNMTFDEAIEQGLLYIQPKEIRW